MLRSKKWFRRFSHAAVSVVALAVVSPEQASAQDTKATDSTSKEAAVTVDSAAVFKLFTALNQEATHARLAQLQKDPALAKALQQVSDKLAVSSTKAKDIEGAVLTLIGKQKIDDAEVTLDAVMLDYYRHNVQGMTDQKDLAAVTSLLERKDRTLTDAAFGKKTGSRGLTAVRRVRQVRR